MRGQYYAGKAPNNSPDPCHYRNEAGGRVSGAHPNIRYNHTVEDPSWEITLAGPYHGPLSQRLALL
jgi:hypothetical protein